MSSTLYIKNMVCVRCKMAVQTVLEENAIPYQSIELGRVTIRQPLTTTEKLRFNEALKRYQLELMEDKSRILVERVKTEIIQVLQSPNRTPLKLSAHLSKALEYNYTYLANTFSELEGITLERYFIAQRVERAKELIVYEDLSLSAITNELNYSSVSHLCLQFKKVSGMTPAEFKKKCLSKNYSWREV